MSKTSIALIWILISLLIAGGCTSEDQDQTVYEGVEYDLVLFTHNAMQPILEKYLPVFEELNDCNVLVDYVSEPISLVDRVIDENNKYYADVVLGINSCNIVWARESLNTIPYKPKTLERTERNFHFDSNYHYIPYIYSFYSFVYDSYEIETPPETFGKLQDSSWKNMFLISDPTTSTNGLGFLLWSVAMFGENGFGHFWRSIKNNIYFTAPLWEQSYSMFLAGESPVLLGFTTTPANFIDSENRYRYKTFIPEEGAFMFVEGAVIMENTNNLPLAKLFIDFVLDMEFQQAMVEYRSMYPVNNRVPLSAALNRIEVPEDIVNDNLSRIFTADRVTNWIDRWQQIMRD